MSFENEELEKVKGMSYFDYVSYLKKKYGEATVPYMTEKFYKNKSVTRTNEGLVCHHVMEVSVSGLYSPKCAKKYSYDYQKPENLVYCNLLEHLLLHLKIAQMQIEKLDKEWEGKVHSVAVSYIPVLGMGGIVDSMAPQLNDLYSGYMGPTWLQACFDVIKDDIYDYFCIMHEVIKCVEYGIAINFYPEDYIEDLISKSYYERYGWDKSNNEYVKDNIKRLCTTTLTPKDVRNELIGIYGESEIERTGIDDCLEMIDAHECSCCQCYDKCCVGAATWIFQDYILIDYTPKSS